MVRLSLPIYYTYGKKTVLYSSNWSRNANFHILNKSKVHYEILVSDKLRELEPIQGKFRVRYTYWYKNKASDGSNVVSQIEKAFLDAIQKIGLVKNDNVMFHYGSCWRVGGIDKENPRMDIELIGEEE
jgi:hypothetical protein